MRDAFDGAKLAEQVGKDRIYPTAREAVAAVSGAEAQGVETGPKGARSPSSSQH